MSSDSILKLNVGGEHFVTTRTTLCAVEDSMMAKMFLSNSPFAPLVEMNGEIFLDRNPAAFRYVLDYLRDGGRLVDEPPEELLPRLRADADYFGLGDLVEKCEQLLERPLKPAPKPKSPRYYYKETCRCSDVRGGWKLVKVIDPIAGKSAKFIFERVEEE